MTVYVVGFICLCLGALGGWSVGFPMGFVKGSVMMEEAMLMKFKKKFNESFENASGPDEIPPF